MFDHDWFHGSALAEQIEVAKLRCSMKRFPGTDPSAVESDSKFAEFFNELEARVLVYLRDGFSYEMKELIAAEKKSHFIFECEPVDEHYKVGTFIVSVPFEDVVRVEVYAVHPDEKPEDVPMITGFRNSPTDAVGQPAPAREDHGRGDR
jgi:hypothetical protein